VKFHAQYEPDENDFKDVHAVCAKFSVPIPRQFALMAGVRAERMRDADRI
jgi:hypothetical protein